MHSLIEDPKSITSLHDPSFLRTAPMGEQCRLSKGGEGNGPAVCPHINSFTMTSIILSLFSTDDNKFFGFVIEHIPLKPMSKPLYKPSITYSTKY